MWSLNQCQNMSDNVIEKYSNQYQLADQKVLENNKWGTRHNQCLLLFTALTVAFTMRSCMGVALVAMVQYNDEHKIISNASDSSSSNRNITEKISDIDDFEFDGISNIMLLTPPYPHFHWSKKVQDTVLSAFFWGYMILQIPAGHFAFKFGARYLLFGAFVINCVISLIFPAVSYYGGSLLAGICRMVQGLSQACIVPGIHTILGKWSPLEERGRMSTAIYVGQPVGIVIGLTITGFIAASPLGWPGIFRFYGILSGITAVCVWFWLADSPAKHNRISVSERKYIEGSLGQNQKKLSLPWKSILTSRGMIAIVIAHISQTWGQVMLFSEVPAYMDKVMGVNIKANGLLTALPFLLMSFANIFYSWFTDMLIMKKYLNVTQTRKLATTIAGVPTVIGFVALAYAPKNIYVIESILIIICCFKIASCVGFYINHIDISPNFAGVMMSISNFTASCVGSFAPFVTGLILTDVTDERLWRIVFFIAAGLYLITNVLYVILGTGEVADWNDSTEYERVALNDNGDTEKDEDGIRDTCEKLDENDHDGVKYVSSK